MFRVGSASHVSTERLGFQNRFRAFHFPEIHYCTNYKLSRHENNQRPRPTFCTFVAQGTWGRGNTCGNTRISSRGLRYSSSTRRRKTPLRPSQRRIHCSDGLQRTAPGHRRSYLRRLRDGMSERKMASGLSMETGSPLIRKAFIVCFNPRPHEGGRQKISCISRTQRSIFFTQ